jgi:CP family cyanate transporter-like MFS transporter
LHDAGYSSEHAGSLHGALQLASAVPALVLVPVVRHLKDQRMAAFSPSIITMTGLLGLLLAPIFSLTLLFRNWHHPSEGVSRDEADLRRT